MIVPVVSNSHGYNEVNGVNNVSIEVMIVMADQYQYLGNCTPTPPLTQH